MKIEFVKYVRDSEANEQARKFGRPLTYDFICKVDGEPRLRITKRYSGSRGYHICDLDGGRAYKTKQHRASYTTGIIDKQEDFERTVLRMIEEDELPLRADLMARRAEKVEKWEADKAEAISKARDRVMTHHLKDLFDMLASQDEMKRAILKDVIETSMTAQATEAAIWFEQQNPRPTFVDHWADNQQGEQA